MGWGGVRHQKVSEEKGVLRQDDRQMDDGRETG